MSERGGHVRVLQSGEGRLEAQRPVDIRVESVCSIHMLFTVVCSLRTISSLETELW
jgi:hypothetical protein